MFAMMSFSADKVPYAFNFSWLRDDLNLFLTRLRNENDQMEQLVTDIVKNICKQVFRF